MYIRTKWRKIKNKRHQFKLLSIFYITLGKKPSDRQEKKGWRG